MQNQINCKNKQNKTKKRKTTGVRVAFLALSPLSGERQNRQGQRDEQGCRGGARQPTAVHRAPPVGLHHRGFGGEILRVRVCGADVSAAAAAAGAAALIACNVRTGRRSAARRIT